MLKKAINPFVKLNNFHISKTVQTKHHLKSPHNQSYLSINHNKTKYLFSSYQKLNTSQFSKQLGLDKQFQQVIKHQKKQQNNSFISSSALFLLSVCIVGGYAFVKLVDKNQSKIFFYKIREIKEKFSFKKVNQKDRQQKQIQRNIEHEQNLKQMYEQDYKHRSGFNMKFLTYIDDYLNEKLLSYSKNFINQNKLGQSFFYILQNLSQKLLAKQPQKKLQKTDNYFLSILEKFMYRSLNSEELTKQVIENKQFVLPTLQKMSKCLLIKGNINQQILAYKMFCLLIQIKIQNQQQNSTPITPTKPPKPPTITFLSFFTTPQLIQLKAQLINNQLKLTSLQNDSSKSQNLSPLQKLNRNIKQQQKVNQMIKNKIVTFNKIIRESIETDRNEKRGK